MSLPPFQSLLDAHGRDVHGYLASLVGRGDAEDCYQETWLAALRGYPRLTHAENLRGWLLTIAHRKAIDCMRARARARAAVPVGGELSGIAVEDDLTATDNNLALLEADGLLAAVRGLPDKQRAAVALRVLLDADYAAVAAAMGTSQAAARRNVHEGLKKLREEYTP